MLTKNDTKEIAISFTPNKYAPRSQGTYSEKLNDIITYAITQALEKERKSTADWIRVQPNYSTSFSMQQMAEDYENTIEDQRWLDFDAENKAAK